MDVAVPTAAALEVQLCVSAESSKLLQPRLCFPKQALASGAASSICCAAKPIRETTLQSARCHALSHACYQVCSHLCLAAEGDGCYGAALQHVALHEALHRRQPNGGCVGGRPHRHGARPLQGLQEPAEMSGQSPELTARSMGNCVCPADCLMTEAFRGAHVSTTPS